MNPVIFSTGSRNCEAVLFKIFVQRHTLIKDHNRNHIQHAVQSILNIFWLDIQFGQHYFKVAMVYFRKFSDKIKTYQWSLSCGDSCTSDILCRLHTVSMFGKIQVLIINASIWTATSSVVHTEKAISIPSGTFVSLFNWTSTIATWKWKTYKILLELSKAIFNFRNSTIRIDK